MKAPALQEVKSADEARNIAIDWSNKNGDEPMSWADTVEWMDYFDELAHKFNLTDEFKENGLI